VDNLDLIFLADTYHHIEYPDAWLSSVWNALKPNGRLAIVDFEREEGKSPHGVTGHARKVTKQTVISEITGAGFVLESQHLQHLLSDNYYFLTFVKGTK
jgi:predicted methyltransferase